MLFYLFMARHCEGFARSYPAYYYGLLRYARNDVAFYSKVIFNANPRISCSNTFNDSGILGFGIGSPFTIAS